MGFRFRKKVKILPGVSLNLSKSGVSTSVKVGPIRWNSRTGKTFINLPGACSYQFDSQTVKAMTKTELEEIAKPIGIKGYSSLKKQELIDLFKQNNII